MKQGIVYTGVPAEQERRACPGIPSEARMQKGRVAVIECVQEIPCNPCEAACKFGAITVGQQITSLPCLDEDACTGCGMCVAQCPGLAIGIVNKAYSETQVDRMGQVVCDGTVVKVIKTKAYAGTSVVSIAIEKQYADQVRSIKRLAHRAEQEG